ncbi:hypothetical protein [Paenibacillus massiliensis]|uniref:hypothetical protein n=1 Tax=Paenibacillus massiliensis TaxID=225917 RepID=UPI0004716AA7|nr:hypothetical protein [Paenibacillus massiliensis]
MSEICTLGKKLSQEAIGVLVRASVRRSHLNALEGYLEAATYSKGRSLWTTQQWQIRYPYADVQIRLMFTDLALATARDDCIEPPNGLSHLQDYVDRVRQPNSFQSLRHQKLELNITSIGLTSIALLGP